MKTEEMLRGSKMVEINDLVTKVISSIVPVLAKDFTPMIKETISTFQQRRTMKTDELTRLAEAIKKNPPVLTPTINIDTLARWFEIPRDDFERLPRERLDPEVLVRHVYLEQLFKTWMEELGYAVTTGEKMLGMEEWEYVPDVYAEMGTLHGVFQVAVNFVCDDPPGTSRVSFVMESL